MLFSNQIMYSHIIYEVSGLIFGIFNQMSLDLLDIRITNLIVKIMVAVFLKKDHGCSIPFNDDILHTDFHGKPWLLPLLVLLHPQYCPLWKFSHLLLHFLEDLIQIPQCQKKLFPLSITPSKFSHPK